MKTVKTIAALLFVLSLFLLQTNAASFEEETEQDFFEGLEEYGVGFEGGEDVLSGVGIDSLLSEIFGALGGSLGGALSFLSMLLGISALISVSEIILDGLSKSSNVGLGVSFISALLIFSRLYPICGSIGESLDELGNFFSTVIPVLSGISLAGGSVNTAAVEALNMNITLSLVSRFSNEFLLPMVFSLFALSLVSGLEDGPFSSVSKMIKGIFMWGLGIASAVVLGAVSLQQIIASAQDTAYMKAAKYAAGGMIPVIGGTVSSALGTLSGGLSYLKSTVGGASVFVLITLSLSPLITLLLYRAALSISASFLEFMNNKGGVRIFSAFKGAVDALISVYTISTIIYISEIVIFMKGGISGVF
jgi:stage III sporulation protein AE